MSEVEVRQPDKLEEIALRVEEDPTFVVPGTGEQIDLRQPAEVARAWVALQDAERQFYKVRSEFIGEVLRLESKRQGTKTLHYEGLDVEVKGGSKPDYDEDLLRDELVKAGCPDDRIEALIKMEVSYRVDWRVVKQLEAANPDYAAAIAKATTRVEAPWRVSVTRK